MVAIALFCSTAFAGSNSGERPYTKVIKTIEVIGKIMTIENEKTAIIVTEKSEELTRLIITQEMRGNNYGTKKIDGKMHYVMRVGIYGLSKESDLEAIKPLLEGNAYNIACHSVLLKDRSNALPICQILVHDKDVFIEMSKHKTFGEHVKLSTNYIHFDLPLHAEYEKTIGNLLISKF